MLFSPADTSATTRCPVSSAMLSALARLFGFSRKKCKICVVGLDNSGKTTILSHLIPESRRLEVHEVSRVARRSPANTPNTCAGGGAHRPAF